MKFTKEGLEEGWFYMSLENEYRPALMSDSEKLRP